MAFDLRLTNAGRAALADGANVGASAVRITHVAIGDGSGPGGADDDALAALRSERMREAAVGSAPVERRIAFRADYEPAAAFDVTEVGVLGNAPGEAVTLLAYWSDGGTAIARTAAGTTTVIAAALEFTDAAADINITVNPAISLGGSALPATTGRRGIVELATSDEAKTGTDGERAVTPKAMRDAASPTLASLLAGGQPVDGTKYALRGKAMGGIGVEEDPGDEAAAQGIAQAQADIATLAGVVNPLPGQVGALTGEVGAVKGRLDTVEGKTRDATTTRKGIAELATSTETQTGTDTARTVTPKGLHDAASKLLAGLKDSAPSAGEKLILEGVAGGGVRVIPSPFELYHDADGVAVAAWNTNGNSSAAVELLADRGAIPIDGTDEWSIAAAGSYLVAFAAARLEDHAISVRLQRKPAGGEWASLSGQTAEGDSITYFASTTDRTTFGTMWSGELAAGDRLRLLWYPTFDRGNAETVTKLVLAIASVN